MIDLFHSFIHSNHRISTLNQSRNPWFREYWRDTFGCRLGDDYNPNHSLPYCDPSLRMNRHTGYVQESKVQFVVDAVYSFAYALNDAWKDLCQPNDGYCRRLKELDGENFYKNYLLNVSFIGKLSVNNFCVYK